MKSIVIDPTAIMRTPSSKENNQARIKKVAQQFESILLKEVTKHAVPKTSLGGDESMASKTWSDMLAHQLADTIASAGSTGLSGMLAEKLSSIASKQSGHEHDHDGQHPITSRFGHRIHPVTGKHHHHNGVDVALVVGTPLLSPFDGRVSRISHSKHGGLSLTVSHPGNRSTTYRHLSNTLAREGDLVRAGQVIAESGDTGRVTGPHLHLEARHDGHTIDPEKLVNRVLKNNAQGSTK